MTFLANLDKTKNDFFYGDHKSFVQLLVRPDAISQIASINMVKQVVLQGRI